MTATCRTVSTWSSIELNQQFDHLKYGNILSLCKGGNNILTTGTQSSKVLI